MEENGSGNIISDGDNCNMKTTILLTAFSFVILTSCGNLNLKQKRLAKMCDCMEKNERNFNNRAAQELLGNPFNTAMTGATALGCAQEIMEKENMNYKEMVGLYQDFLKSDCAARFGIDAASIEKAEKEAKEEQSRIMSNDDQNGNSEQPVDGDIQPQIDTMPVQQYYSDTPSHSSDFSFDSSLSNTQPMSDDEAQKMFNKYVNPTLEKLGEQSVKKSVISDYPASSKD